MSVSSRIGTAPFETEATPRKGLATVLYRIGAGILLLIVAVAAATVFLVTLDLVPVATVTAVFQPIGDVLGTIPTADLLDRALVAGVAAVVGVAALALLARSPAGVTQAAGRHVLQADEQGLVVIGSESVETIAVQAAVMTPGVLEATVKARGRPTGPVRLRVLVEVLPGADVKRIGAKVQQAVRSSVEDLVGLAVRDANVEVHVMDPEDFAGVL